MKIRELHVFVFVSSQRSYLYLQCTNSVQAKNAPFNVIFDVENVAIKMLNACNLWVDIKWQILF